MRVKIKREGPNGPYLIPKPSSDRCAVALTLDAAMQTAKGLYKSPNLEIDLVEIEERKE